MVSARLKKMFPTSATAYHVAEDISAGDWLLISPDTDEITTLSDEFFRLQYVCEGAQTHPRPATHDASSQRGHRRMSPRGNGRSKNKRGGRLITDEVDRCLRETHDLLTAQDPSYVGALTPREIRNCTCYAQTLTQKKKKGRTVIQIDAEIRYALTRLIAQGRVEESRRITRSGTRKALHFHPAPAHDHLGSDNA